MNKFSGQWFLSEAIQSLCNILFGAYRRSVILVTALVLYFYAATHTYTHIYIFIVKDKREAMINLEDGDLESEPTHRSKTT